MDNIQLSLAETPAQIETFWNLFNEYINELSLNATYGNDFDLDYFYSDEYRDAILHLKNREKNPLRLVLFSKDQNLVGFLMYVTYFDEGGKCFIMEYYIRPRYRNFGLGKYCYHEAEKHILSEGASYIELTPTNDKNEGFWKSLSYEKTTDLDEDNKYYYRKQLNYHS